MSRLMHLTALLLSLLVGGQSVASVADGWICRASGTPMSGCPCSAPHSPEGGHADEDGISSAACCDRIEAGSETSAQPATATSERVRVSVDKALWPNPAFDVTHAVRGIAPHRAPTPARPTPTGPPVYLQLRQLLI